MIARRIMILAVVFVLGSAYFIFFRERHDFVWVFAASLLVLTVTYVFQHQIDQMFIRGVPQQIDGSMHEMMLLTAPYYKSLSIEHMLMMQDRMARWVLRKEMIQKNENKPPQDLMYIISYYAVLLTLHQEDFRYDIFDRIVFYEHPFLSPGITDDVHIVEVESVDGTMIFSIPHLLKGHLEKGYYNIAVHANAEAYQIQYMKETVAWEPDIWERLEEVSGISRHQLDAYIGLPQENPWPVAVHHQVTYRGATIPEVLRHFPQLQNQT